MRMIFLENMSSVRIRWKVLIPTLFIGLFLFYSIVNKALLSIYVKCEYGYKDENDMKLRSVYCNSEEPEGQEGAMSTSKYQLKQVIVAVRHGDRYLLHNWDNLKFPNISCKITGDLFYVQDHKKLILAYSEAMNRYEIDFPVKHLSGNLQPKSTLCKDGMLTPKGVLQHLLLGQFMRQSYHHWKFLKNDQDINLSFHVRTSKKQRTIHSAMAFMYGYLKNKFLPRMVHFSQSESNNLCISKITVPDCSCPAIDGILEHVTAQTFRQNRSDVTLQSRYLDIASDMARVFKLHKNPPLSSMLDVSMIHLCHKLPLPGNGKLCLQPKTFINIHDLILENGKNSARNEDYLKIARLKMHPLLSEIAHNMEKLKNGGQIERFILYSAHDSTIEPLIMLLGVSDGKWPPYASRLVFELYKVIDSGEYVLRVLYQGIDVTSQVSFCKSKLTADSLCPLEELSEFVSQANLESLGFSSYEAACKTRIHL